MRILFSFFFALMISLCSMGQGTITHTFKILGMTCDNCANTAAGALSELSGVNSATVDFETRTATVVAAESVTQDELRQAIKEKNFQPLFKGEQEVLALTPEEKKGLDIKVVEGGGKIKVTKYITEGQITVFDFYADWSGPCKIFSPKVERLLLHHKNVKLVKADIVNWESALSKQLTQKYQFPSLPFVLVFNDKGKLLGKVHGNFINKVEAIVSEGEK